MLTTQEDAQLSRRQLDPKTGNQGTLKQHEGPLDGNVNRINCMLPFWKARSITVAKLSLRSKALQKILKAKQFTLELIRLFAQTIHVEQLSVALTE